MSNTSDQTTKPSKETRLIVGEVGVDTETGIVGKGHSYDNGKTFVVDDTIYGRVYHADDHGKIWKGIEDQVAKVVAPAKSAADSAVAYTNDAIEKSRVNSQAIVDINSAVSEAKAAMDSATAEIQQTAANAASDAAKIRADVAQVQSEVDTAKAANSASVEALKSDASAAKQDIQAARQANENVAKQLDDYTKQAQAQGKTIKDIQDAQDGYTATLADVKGNVSKISDAVDGLSASLKDDQDNVATIKAKADELSATLTDHDKNIAQLTASAKKLSSTLEDADGRLSKIEQTASTLVSEFSDQQGRLNKVEQKATGTEQTVANQQGQINTIKTDASGIHETLTGQGNQIANINVTLSGLNTKYEGVSGDLGKLKSQVQWTTVTDAVDLNNVKTPCHEFLKGTVTNAPNEVAWWYLTVEGSESGRITQTVIADHSNNRYTRRWADNWSAWVKDATQTDVTALSNRITTNSTQITQNKQAIDLKADQSTVDNLSGEVSQNSAQLKVQAGQISSKVSSTDFKTLNDKVNGIQVGGRNLITGTSSDWAKVTNDRGPHWPLNPDEWKAGDTITISAEIRNGSQNIFIGFYNTVNGQTNTVPSKVSIPAGKEGRLTFAYKLPEGTTVVRPTVFPGSGTGTFEYRKLKAEKGNVATDWTPAPEDTITAIQKNSTAINQTNQKISLKADQTEVDKIKNTASQNSSRLNVMANEISSKVTSTDVNNIVDSKGYATTSTVQSLITQKAGTINESITNLTSKINSNNGGGVNFAKNTINASYSGNSGSGRIGDISLEDMNELRGQTITLSVDVEWTGWQSASGANRIGWELQAIYADGSTFNNWLGVWATPTTASGKQRVSATYAIPDKEITSLGEGAAFVQISCTSAKVSHLKIERGSVATPWTPAPSDNATVTQVQQITASIDGLQSTVSNKADKSQITQLSNTIQSKVSSSDFNNLRKAVDLQTLDSADINNMKTNGHYFVRSLANTPIPGWVYVDVTGNGAGRIRQDVYQDNGNQHKYRRWVGTSWTAWTQGATESEITQLRDDINLRVKSGDLLSQINIQAGQTLIQSKKLYLASQTVIFSDNAFIPNAAITNLDASKLTFYGSDNTYATMGASVAQYDDDKTKSTINLQYDGGIEIHASSQQGSILTMHDNTIRLASKSWGDNPNSYQYSGFYAAPNYSLINTYHKDGTTSGVAIDNDRIWIYGGSKNQQLGALQADVGWYSINGRTGSLTGDQISLKTGNTQTILKDNNININNASDTNSKNYDVGIHVKGWAEMTGWFTCMGLTQTSLLSTKTRIVPLDTKVALDKIVSADVGTYQFKTDVAKGKTKRHASVIIDDVHDVAEYYTPEEFISEDRKGRDDGDIVGYLMGAVQELKKQLDEVKEKI